MSPDFQAPECQKEIVKNSLCVRHWNSFKSRVSWNKQKRHDFSVYYKQKYSTKRGRGESFAHKRCSRGTQHHGVPTRTMDSPLLFLKWHMEEEKNKNNNLISFKQCCIQITCLKPDKPTFESLEQGVQSRHEASHFPCFSVMVWKKELGPNPPSCGMF